MSKKLSKNEKNKITVNYIHCLVNYNKYTYNGTPKNGFSI